MVWRDLSHKNFAKIITQPVSRAQDYPFSAKRGFAESWQLVATSIRAAMQPRCLAKHIMWHSSMT